MVVGRRNVHSKEIDRLSRGLEAQARVGKYDNAERNQKGCNDSFCIHNKFITNSSGALVDLTATARISLYKCMMVHGTVSGQNRGDYQEELRRIRQPAENHHQHQQKHKWSIGNDGQTVAYASTTVFS